VNTSSKSTPASTGTGPDDDERMDDNSAWLAAILNPHVPDWTLPLGLQYPTPRMTQEHELLCNLLDLRRADSQRKYDDEFTQLVNDFVQQVQDAENRVLALQERLETVTEETRRRQAAAARQRREEEQRRRRTEREERERQRREEERQAQREAEALREQRAQEEQATEQAFSNSRSATAFGGRGDLRMCRRCQTGPFENKACSDLGAHNSWESRDVRTRRRPNECPNCGWYNSDWHQWPVFDGIYGPH